MLYIYFQGIIYRLIENETISQSAEAATTTASIRWDQLWRPLHNGKSW